ncbi:unnamed protein product [Ostreobium quekettii]|uniref:Uncharacterized protein n=1 Tax=Ostreobium quekettii TaxID=121088 RepID=A0A8S1IRQ8_9CHLO|nr:unnamed protein product [Ostreobium quekettii]
MALMALIRNALVNARKYVPPNVKLVELFGYTLGGFYLARYTDSPAGAFDELVVLGGLAWNRPTSCAWAARVYVNNRHARTHGLTHCGLPSRLASFKATPNNDATVMMRGGSKWGGTWWNTDEEIPPQAVVVRNRERWLWFFNSRNGLRMPVCTFNFNNAKKGAKGPRIKMYLPSYSGCTPHVRDMLKYSLELRTNVSLVRPVQLTLPPGEEDKENREMLTAVLCGKPLVALSFNDMEMNVEAPEVVVRQGPKPSTPNQKL